MKRPIDIYVGNLSMEATEKDLLKLFESCGKVLEVKITRDKMTNLGKACVTMEEEFEALRAVEVLANKLLHNKALVLMLDANREFFRKYA